MEELKGSLAVPLIVVPTLATLMVLTASGLVDRRAFGPAFIAYVWGIASWRIADWNARRQLRALWPESGGMLGERRLTVDDDGITSEAVTGDSGITTGQYSWRVIRDVTEQAGLTLLWLSGPEAVIVPARAWADEPHAVISSRSSASGSRRLANEAKHALRANEDARTAVQKPRRLNLAEVTA